ncbi:hypothetical protein DPEC_G00062080 [Dallia pectoralis]|uniref:Uncharacterized protein n=1 Tax=Dallia pectoralis TaxID=75939 RepID=A0ACC2H7B8_DALPE|nr:hypothetical protein DPEC_G00062080 [Dallia pectoralis]
MGNPQSNGGFSLRCCPHEMTTIVILCHECSLVMWGRQHLDIDQTLVTYSLNVLLPERQGLHVQMSSACGMG